MKRNLTFVNLPSISQSTFKASRRDLTQSKIVPDQQVDKFKVKNLDIDSLDVDKKPTKRPSSDELWRMALENSRKKRNTELNNSSMGTPQSSYIYRINRDLDLCPRPSQNILSWQPNILAITMLSAMLGIALYFTTNNQENTLNMISQKFKIFS